MSLRSRSSALWEGIARRRRMEAEMQAEMLCHITACVEDQVRAGVPRSQAERLARVEFGAIESFKEECRAARGVRFWDELTQDLRYSFRTLRKSPGFTAVAALTLAVGIGANAAVFTAVDSWVLRPLPFPGSERLVAVWASDTRRGGAMPATPADFNDWRKSNPYFEGMAGWRKASFTLRQSSLHQAADPEQIEGALVTAGFFRVLGVAPALGRDFSVEDDAPGAAPVGLLADGLWRSHFAADPRLPGKTILVNGRPVTVAGILPPGFQFSLAGRTDIWMPFAMPAAQARSRSTTRMQVIARVKPGVGVERAGGYLAAVARNLEREYPATNTHRGVRVRSLRQEVNRDIQSDAMLLVFGVVACVLLIACSNVANMLLGRAANRQTEFAIRLAIGAGRFRLVRQALTETLVLFLGGAVLALLVAAAGVKWLAGSIPSEMRPYLPNFGALSVDAPTLTYAFAVAAITGIVFGLAPALEGVRPPRALASPSRNRLRKALVAVQLSQAFFVLVVAGLLIKSMDRIYNAAPGFESHNLLTARVALAGERSTEPARVRAFYEEVLERILLAPHVKAAGAVQFVPFGLSNGTTTYRREDLPAPPPGEFHSAEYSSATPGYLNALGLRQVRGRWISEQDRADSHPVAVVSQAMAQLEWPGEDPVGKQIRLGLSPGVTFTVAGVVQDVRIVALDEPREPQVYVPFRQIPSLSMSIVVRTAGDPSRMVPEIRQAVAAVDRNQAVFDVQPMVRRIATAHVANAIASQTMSRFAAIALFLAAIGVYGVISYSVATRKREIGVRMALGAGRRTVVCMLLRQGLRLSGIGLAAGLVFSIAASRLLSALLFEVSPRDGATFLVVSLLLAAVALIACYIPARRAAAVDPAITLRYE